ncbi:hypothetical protein [Rubrivirga sp.]|uniref:hypothetical protein n=1 Tax=Rubrivirga sp. TaxID=1885344 RepID=UPI003C78D8BA
MDSTQALEPPVAADLPEPSETSKGALARLGRVLPGIHAVVRLAYRLALVSAVAAGLIVLAVGTAERIEVGAGALWVLGLILLTPAAALAVAGWTIADLVSLPGEIRDAAIAAASREDGVVKPRRSRIGRLVASLWAARGLALLSKDGWLKAVGALRFLRLASLPFMLGLLGFVMLNGLVILGGLVALVALLVP